MAKRKTEKIKPFTAWLTKYNSGSWSSLIRFSDAEIARDKRIDKISDENQGVRTKYIKVRVTPL